MKWQYEGTQCNIFHSQNWLSAHVPHRIKKTHPNMNMLSNNKIDDRNTNLWSLETYIRITSKTGTRHEDITNSSMRPQSDSPDNPFCPAPPLCFIGWTATPHSITCFPSSRLGPKTLAWRFFYFHVILSSPRHRNGRYEAPIPRKIILQDGQTKQWQIKAPSHPSNRNFPLTALEPRCTQCYPTCPKRASTRQLPH